MLYLRSSDFMKLIFDINVILMEFLIMVLIQIYYL